MAMLHDSGPYWPDAFQAHTILLNMIRFILFRLRVSCPILFEFLICPDARLKPQGLGGSYLQRVLRGFRMSIHLMFHVFAAFLAASF